MICCLVVGAAVVAAGGYAGATKRRRSAETHTPPATVLPANAEHLEGDERSPDGAPPKGGGDRG
jgi:hypothetical protein